MGLPGEDGDKGEQHYFSWSNNLTFDQSIGDMGPPGEKGEKGGQGDTGPVGVQGTQGIHFFSNYFCRVSCLKKIYEKNTTYFLFHKYLCIEYSAATLFQARL